MGSRIFHSIGKFEWHNTPLSIFHSGIHKCAYQGVVVRDIMHPPYCPPFDSKTGGDTVGGGELHEKMDQFFGGLFATKKKQLLREVH